MGIQLHPLRGITSAKEQPAMGRAVVISYQLREATAKGTATR
jgi:hypothetical protein